MNNLNQASPSSRSSANANTTAGLAYLYYLEEGCPEGRALDHWVRAERELSTKTNPSEKDVNGVPVAELSRFVAEGGTGISSVPKPDQKLSATRERIREQSSAVAHSPRQSSRPLERSRQTR